MPTIIPKGYYCPKCKKEIKKKVCECGANAKPIPPYTVRFRWINENGIEEHKRLTGTPPWTTQSAAQKGYEQWISNHPDHKEKSTDKLDFISLYNEYKQHLFSTVKESSYVTFCQRMDSFVVPVFSNYKVTEITAADILKWQDSLSAQGYSYKYKSAIRQAFIHFFNYLKIYDIPNPLSKVKGFRRLNERKKEMLFWTEDEFKKFIYTVDDLTYKTLFSFMYLTGCRKGEALSLHWTDLQNNSVKIEKTLSAKTVSKQYIETTPKTENSYRSVLLPPNLLNLLKQLKQQSSGDLIFGGRQHLPFQTVTNNFERYIKLSGVKQIRIHDLRHSHVSFLINHGDNQLSTLYVIAQRIGDTPEQILKTYGHLFPNRHQAFASELNIPLSIN